MITSTTDAMNKSRFFFLDLHLEIQNNSIISANKYLYLSPTTEHRSYIMINVIKSELQRYWLYCTFDADFQSDKN